MDPLSQRLLCSLRGKPSFTRGEPRDPAGCDISRRDDHSLELGGGALHGAENARRAALARARGSNPRQHARRHDLVPDRTLHRLEEAVHTAPPLAALRRAPSRVCVAALRRRWSADAPVGFVQLWKTPWGRDPSKFRMSKFECRSSNSSSPKQKASSLLKLKSLRALPRRLRVKRGSRHYLAAERRR